MAKKPLYKKLIANTEKKARTYSKFFNQATKAVAAAIVKELKLKVKHYDKPANDSGTRSCRVKVVTRDSIDPDAFKAIVDDIGAKYRGFIILELSADQRQGFTVTMYATQPFGWAGKVA